LKGDSVSNRAPESATKFTVLICTHNRAAVLARTLDSVSALDFGERWEILVVDNASADDTAGIVTLAAATHSVPIRYVRENTPGKSAALNAGLIESRGEFIAFTDDDTFPDHGWLRHLERAFETENADWVFGPIQPAWLGDIPDWYSSRVNGNLGLLDYGTERLVITARQYAFYGANCAATRTALQRLGRFRDDLSIFGGIGGGEDIEMFERALQNQQRIVYEPGAVVKHTIFEDRLSKRYHWSRAWTSRRQYYIFMTRDAAVRSRLLGVPRYVYRLALEDIVHYLRSILTWRTGDVFFYEIRLVKFAGLVLEAVQRRAARLLGRDRLTGV
jgi:glycosyltransferase involved in cell wall biosynthesis